MADRPERPGFRFPGPVPQEALDYFREKRIRPGFDFRDVWGREHASAFTVAKAVQLDVLEDIRQALRRHLEEGLTFESFRKELTPVLQKKGWWGRKEVVDPRTGDTVEAQLGSPRRLKTVFRSNMRAARAAGQWARIRRTKAALPFLLYRLGPSREHREDHVAWSGTLLPADDPWWRDHFTPNGWGCRCWVRQVSRVEAQRLGGQTPRPPRDMREWTNPRTGDTVRVDRGLDPAWASNPGLDRERALAAKLKSGIDAADEALARAAVRQIVESPLLDRQLAPMKREDPPKGDLPIGWLKPAWRDMLDVRTQVAALSQQGARHQWRRHRELGAADYRGVLQELLESARPENAFLETDRGGVDLVLYHRRGGKLWGAVLTRSGPRRVFLKSFSERREEQLERARAAAGR